MVYLKIKLNQSLLLKLSIIVLLFSFNPAPISNAYDQTSDFLAYSYIESFQTSETEDKVLNFTLNPIYYTLFVNVSFANVKGLFTYSEFDPISLLFVNNNTEVQLSTTYVGINGVHFNYYYLEFTPSFENSKIQLTFFKGYVLDVDMRLFGYKDFSKLNEFQSVRDANNDNNTPSTFFINQNQSFYGLLGHSDLGDYYQFNFNQEYNVTIQISMIEPVYDHLLAIIGYNQTNSSLPLKDQINTHHGFNETFYTDSVSIGIKKQYIFDVTDTPIMYVYNISISSSEFPILPQSSTTANSSEKSQVRTSSFIGIEYIIPVTFVLMTLSKKKYFK